MDVVLNASPIIFLSKIDRIWLLERLFSTIYIPTAVLNEIKICDNAETYGILTSIVFNPLQVHNRTAIRGLLGRLHIGEVEVLVGAVEKSISTVVLDDKYARNKAKQLGLTVIGTLGILLKAKKTGLIDDITQDIAKLKNTGMYLSDEVIAKVLT